MDAKEESKSNHVTTSEQELKSKPDTDSATLITFLLNEIRSQDDGSRLLITYNIGLALAYIYFIMKYGDKMIHYSLYINLLFIILPIFLFYFSVALAVRNLRPSIDKSTLNEGISPEYLVHLVEDKNKEFVYACQLMAIGFVVILIGFACYLFIL